MSGRTAKRLKKAYNIRNEREHRPDTVAFWRILKKWYTQQSHQRKAEFLAYYGV